MLCLFNATLLALENCCTWQFWCGCTITSVRPFGSDSGRLSKHFEFYFSKHICATSRLPQYPSGLLGAEKRYVHPFSARLNCELLEFWNELEVATATFPPRNLRPLARFELRLVFFLLCWDICLFQYTVTEELPRRALRKKKKLMIILFTYIFTDFVTCSNQLSVVSTLTETHTTCVCSYSDPKRLKNKIKAECIRIYT